MEFKASRSLGTLPLFLSMALGSFVAFPQVRANPVLFRTFPAVAALLALWWVALAVWMRTKGQVPAFAVVLLKQHYLQACAHLSILLYWGWYFRQVYAEGYLILAQLLFAYAFDMLLQLSRRGRYTLGFGPFPIIFSTNLFLWFVDDFFYFQFALISVGFLAKEFLHWQRGGKSVHIFNPSSFPLAIVSWILLFTHKFGITWGEHIAGTQFRPPHIYAFIFLVSLPGQFLFGVVTMTLAAVVTMYTWAAAYLALTGFSYSFEAYIPIAVFLAMHLLFTDPSTSPRSELARILYGIAYAATVIVLEATIKPPFPSKLLLVPVLNLAVPLFERASQSRALRWIDPTRIFAPALTGRQRNLAYIAVWATVFGVMLTLRGIGDRYPGQEIPFWRQLCQDGFQRACGKMIYAETLDCGRGSGWACNEYGAAEHLLGQDPVAQGAFRHGCELGFAASCDNQDRWQGMDIRRAMPMTADYPILMSSFKWIRRDRLAALPESQLRAEACTGGWIEACGRPR